MAAAIVTILGEVRRAVLGACLSVLAGAVAEVVAARHRAGVRRRRREEEEEVGEVLPIEGDTCELFSNLSLLPSLARNTVSIFLATDAQFMSVAFGSESTVMSRACWYRKNKTEVVVRRGKGAIDGPLRP